MGTPRTETLRFLAREDVGIEDFGDRSLALLCDSLRLREIDSRSRRLLELLDGERTVRDIAAIVAAGCAAAVDEILEPVAEALLDMERQGLVRRRARLIQERPGPMNDERYLANPDVSFRQEDDDGGILFNPDTDALEVINPTAVAIWTFLAAPRARAEVVAHLCEVCLDAPRAQVEKDVEEFLDSLLKKGFVGVVEETA